MARKILLADDSVTAQNMGRKILADAGYEVLTVNNGSAALKKIAEAKPELIVLDVYMPGYSGLEVCQRLKEAQETSRIPVLLTVGKLEPFKPEEARRVRADGFIVKPFEASELLSALSKLEDKIVPGREAAKPGRFARANAALDEGRYDKSMAIEEDSSWKNRIAFPSKKKKAAEEEVEDPAISKSVNKDGRTATDRKSSSKPETKAEEPRVNLEALAPEGLPKDVTPEEIAALAAAAAQVQGKIADSKIAEPSSETVAPEVKAVEAKPSEVEAKAVEAKTEAVPESKEVQPAVEAPGMAETTAPVASAESSEVEKPAEVSKDADRVPSPSSADVIAAISALERDADKSRTDSGSIASSHESPAEPVTMAAAAGAGYTSAPSRWTAVSVDLAADEAALSLEQEMHQAHAALVAESSHVASPATLAEPAPAPAAEATSFEKVSAETTLAEPPTAEKTFEAHPVSAEPAIVAEPSTPIAAAKLEPTSSATNEPTQAESAVPTPELNDIASSIGAPPTDAITAAVRELEAAAAAYEAQRAAAPEPAPQAIESVLPAPEPSQTVEVVARHEEIPAETTQSALAQEPAETSVHKEHQDLSHEKQGHEEEKHETPASVAEIAAAAPEPAPAISDEKPEIQTPISADDVSREPASHIASQDESATPVISAAKGKSEPSNKEHDIAETTAAAWASWRRIRETGDGRSSRSNSKDQSDSRDEAAMAVAAGAEKSPEDISAAGSESGEIDSIVDSVLADLRPKIVEEISRKLGKKK